MEIRLNSALAVVNGIGPSDEVEAMFAAQMAATHGAAMRLLSRADHAEQILQFEANGNMAIKLMCTYTAQVEALAKLRRGGEQTVRVEHVLSTPVVRPSSATSPPDWPRRGVGATFKNSEQPYETNEQETRALVFAPGSPVWGANAPWDTVQVKGGKR